MRIGLLSINDPRRGLWRDAEAVLWALEEEPVRHNEYRPTAVSLFAIPNYRQIANKPGMTQAVATRVPCPSAVPPGTNFTDWLSNIDVLVSWEKILPRTFNMARQRGVRIVYIPHLEWCELGGKVSRWQQAVKKSGCQVWAKTPQIAAALRAAKIPCKFVSWSIPDPVARSPCKRDDTTVTFLINAGMGGWRNRRGVDIALKAYAQAAQQRDNIRLILKSIKPLHCYVPEALLAAPGIEQIEGLISRAELNALHQRADAVLYPSRWEGFGLSLLEALHIGLPVIAADGWPMNELVEHGHNGLLARTQQVGRVRLAPHWECDPEALAQQMVSFATNSELRRRLTCPELAELVARQHQFRLRIRQLLLQQTVPRIVICRRHSKPGWRRSEEYWADALRHHGYIVDIAYYESSVTKLQKQLNKAHDFVLVSKAPTAFLKTVRRLTQQPIILWHHDACTPRKKWMQTAAQLVDLICVPESDLEKRLSGLSEPIITLMPGAKVDGDRGPGRRPIALESADCGPEVVFLGNKSRNGGNRERILSTLSRFYDVHVFGRGWPKGGWRAHPPVWSDKATAVNRRAHIVLSVSYSAKIPHYTSNRLFNACGSGACVVAETYPGLDDHYPPQAVACFSQPSDCVSVVRRLLADDLERSQMRTHAAEHTWRQHTWNDRVSVLLNTVRSLFSVRAAKTEALKLWEARAQRLGDRAVGYYRWDDSKLRQETETRWQRLYPHLKTHDIGENRLILDFGCGNGRFATKLAEKNHHVVGLDISPTLLQLARNQTQPGLEFIQIAPGERLPFPAGAFDGLWTYTVLQHIAKPLFNPILTELKRVLQPNGLLLLCENTESSNGRLSESGHVTYRSPDEYIAAFPGIAAVDTFTVAGEQHTVFAGRLNAG